MAARALALFYVALGAFLVMLAGLAVGFTTKSGVTPVTPGPRWACATDEYVVIATGECLHVDGLDAMSKPPTTWEDPISPNGEPVPFNPAP